MERQSSKHGPRLDDELKHETESLVRGSPVESHSEEDREQEPAADEERTASARTAPADELGPDESSARREISRHLRASVFPAKRDQLLEEAASANAPDPVLRALEQLPPDREFATMYEVWDAIRERRAS